MNVVELCTPDGKPCGVFACGKCNWVMHWNNKVNPSVEQSARVREHAENCCSQTCGVCGVAVPGTGWRYCDAHRQEGWRRDEAEREKKAFEAAKERTDYAGPFLIPGRFADESELLADLTAVARHYQERGEPVPEYVWVPRLETLSLSAHRVICQELEDFHSEDAGDEIDTADREELQALLDGWCAKQTVRTWHEERTEYVRVPKPNTEG